MIRRFSEDIDITIDTLLSQGQKKKIKQAIMDSAQELGMTIENLDETRSRRDYNRYVIAYDSVIPMASAESGGFVGNILYGSILSDCFTACP